MLPGCAGPSKVPRNRKVAAEPRISKSYNIDKAVSLSTVVLLLKITRSTEIHVFHSAGWMACSYMPKLAYEAVHARFFNRKVHHENMHSKHARDRANHFRFMGLQNAYLSLGSPTFAYRSSISQVPKYRIESNIMIIYTLALFSRETLVSPRSCKSGQRTQRSVSEYQ